MTDIHEPTLLDHLLSAVLVSATKTLPPRQVWAHEPQNFTRWLAQNIGGLGEAIGIPMRLLKAKAVGERRIADLLACDERDGSTVVIENQLEAADYTHLGQILTYAAATDARSAVWVGPQFDPDFLETLRWLNVKAGPAVGFYAVRVKVLQVGQSAAGVTFDVLVRPGELAVPVRRQGLLLPSRASRPHSGPRI